MVLHIIVLHVAWTPCLIHHPSDLASTLCRIFSKAVS